MLALTREPIEGADTSVIKVGGIDVKFTIVWVDGHKVRMAIDAPEEVKVMREKLLDTEPSVT